MDNEGFKIRLLELQGSETARNFARSIGLGESTYRALLKVGNPTLNTLLTICQKLEISLEWLATGEGFMLPTAAEALSAPKALPSIHGTLLKLVGRAITRIYKDEGVKLPADALIEEIGGRYNELIARAENPTDLDELTSLIPWLENKVRKELQAAASEPGTGKHSA